MMVRLSFVALGVILTTARCSLAVPYGPAATRPQSNHYGQKGGSSQQAAGGGGLNNGGSGLPAGCRIEYQTVQTIIEVEKEENVCNPVTDRVCSTKYRKACSPYTDNVCKVTNREVCQTKYEQKCRTKYRQVPETYHEDECREEDRRVCDSHWVQRGRDKVWEEDPTTCKFLP